MTFDQIRKKWKTGKRIRFGRPHQASTYEFTTTGRLKQINSDGRDTRLSLLHEDFDRTDWRIAAAGE